MSTFVPSLNHNRQQRPPPPPKLQLKSSSHWNSKIDLQFCTDNGITIRPEQTVSWWSRSYLRSWKDKRIGNVHNVRTAVVDLQRSLVYSAKCRKNKMVLTGELFKQWWNKDMKVREYYRTPFHDDLLENWGKRWFMICILCICLISYECIVYCILLLICISMRYRGICWRFEELWWWHWKFQYH